MRRKDLFTGAAVVFEGSATEVLGCESQAHSVGKRSEKTQIPTPTGRIQDLLLVQIDPLRDVFPPDADSQIADVRFQPLDPVPIAVGEANPVLARLETQAGVHVIEAFPKPIDPQGVVVLDRQQISQVGVGQEAEAIRVAESDLLTL